MSIVSGQQNPKNFINFISIIGAILLPVTTLFMVWAIQRGLNVTDEGMYLLSSQSPVDVKFGLTSYHLYTSLIFHSVGQNIIAFRFVRLVMDIFAGTVLFIGLNRFITQHFNNSHDTIIDKASKISLLILGAMFAYFWFLPTPSYNSINSFALTVSSGLLLLLSVETEKYATNNTQKTWLFLFMVGLCIGLSFFVKFTTGVLLFIVFSFYIAINTRLNIQIKFNRILIILAGISSWAFLHFTFIQSPVLWWQYFVNGMQLTAAMSAGYDASSLTRYFHEIVRLGKSALYDFWALHLLILLGLSCIHSFTKHDKNNVRFISVLFGAVFTIAALLSIYHQLYVGGQSQSFNLSRFYLRWLFLLLTAVVSSLTYGHVRNDEESTHNFSGMLPVGLLLFCLPFAGAIGTGAPIYIIMLYALAPWFGLLLLMSALLSGLHRIRWIAPVVCVMFSSFACAQIVTGSLYYPYQLLTGLTGQTQATEVGYPATTLKLDPVTSEYFTQLKVLAQKNGFKPGNDILAFYDLPGVVFALGGRSPALSWFIGNPRKSPAASAEKALSFADKDRLKRAFILQTSKSDRSMPDLGKFGLNFPSGYMLCGEVNNPYDSQKGTVRLWKPL